MQCWLSPLGCSWDLVLFWECASYFFIVKLFLILGRRFKEFRWPQIWTPKRAAACVDWSGSTQEWSPCETGSCFGRDQEVYGPSKYFSYLVNRDNFVHISIVLTHTGTCSLSHVTSTWYCSNCMVWLICNSD